jgi:hypothetical protein
VSRSSVLRASWPSGSARHTPPGTLCMAWMKPKPRREECLARLASGRRLLPRAEQPDGPARRAASPGEHGHEQEHERDRANDSGERRSLPDFRHDTARRCHRTPGYAARLCADHALRRPRGRPRGGVGERPRTTALRTTARGRTRPEFGEMPDPTDPRHKPCHSSSRWYAQGPFFVVACCPRSRGDCSRSADSRAELARRGRDDPRVSRSLEMTVARRRRGSEPFRPAGVRSRFRCLARIASSCATRFRRGRGGR